MYHVAVISDALYYLFIIIYSEMAFVSFEKIVKSPSDMYSVN